MPEAQQQSNPHRGTRRRNRSFAHKSNRNIVTTFELQLITVNLIQVYQHDLGEIWHIRCSPHDASSFVTCYYNPMAGQFNMGTALLKLPTTKVISDDTVDTVTSSGVQKNQLGITQVYDVEVRSMILHNSDFSLVSYLIFTRNMERKSNATNFTCRKLIGWPWSSITVSFCST